MDRMIRSDLANSAWGEFGRELAREVRSAITDHVARAVAPLQARIAGLEAKIVSLESELEMTQPTTTRSRPGIAWKRNGRSHDA
jgi:hypothetical protein